jgi:hypothetical protein
MVEMNSRTQAETDCPSYGCIQGSALSLRYTTADMNLPSTFEASRGALLGAIESRNYSVLGEPALRMESLPNSPLNASRRDGTLPCFSAASARQTIACKYLFTY